MYASSSSVNPTPLAHADNQRDVHPRGEYHKTQSRFIPLSMSTAHHTVDGANARGFQSRATVLHQSNSETWAKEARCLPQGIGKDPIQKKTKQKRTKNHTLNHQSVLLLDSACRFAFDELILDQAPQDINEEGFQIERVLLPAFIAATEPG
ncbi:hypothetical protein TNCV_3532361 [Trichonephila clavipes]|nr:hypothetical protein TNCV_3532361 [Trichonephila clavipes]